MLVNSDTVKVDFEVSRSVVNGRPDDPLVVDLVTAVDEPADYGSLGEPNARRFDQLIFFALDGWLVPLVKLGKETSSLR